MKLVFSKIGELNWDIKKLLQYLLKQESNLKDQEWSYLMKESWIPVKSYDGSTGSFNECSYSLPVLKKLPPTQVHFVDDQNHFLAFKLPVLEWLGPLSSSEKGFLRNLGVREHPNLSDILTLCTNSDVLIANTALEYLLTHFEAAYKKDYKELAREKIPSIVPTRMGTRVSPMKAFFNDISGKYEEKELKMLCDYLEAYPVAQGYRDVVSKLGVPHHVPVAGLIDKLTKFPPSREEAPIVFDFACNFQSEISAEQWKQLNGAEIIPFGYLCRIYFVYE